GAPEGAAEKLMLSAADQDPAAAIGVLSPGEFEGLDDVYDKAFERAEDEELVEGDGITDALDIELSDLEFDVEELGDDLARVTLTGGEYDVSWDPEKLPERLEFLSEESEADSESGDLEELFDGEEVSVMTVKIDGRWYVTLLGTVADYAYQDAVDDSDEELAEPDWDAAAEDVDAIVGDDPEAVIENLVEAINGDDVEDLLANLPEELVKPLRPYAGVVQEFLDDNGLADDEIGVEVTVADLDLSTEELDDGRVKVVIERGTFSGSAFEIADGYTEEGSGSINVAGDCIEIYEAGSLQDETCLGEEETVEDLGLDEIFFVVREVDDGYQLDPAATWTEYASIAVENLTDDLIDMIVEEIEEEV
ncbi:hypothetical protein, partial [Nocardioides stalactiti]|uniref:hypothetical protein n=1 Tax=Nocardioides stalactiti TaxID=2755356 RepID=UPI001601FD1D